jgi:hypothetical protein
MARTRVTGLRLEGGSVGAVPESRGDRLAALAVAITAPALVTSGDEDGVDAPAALCGGAAWCIVEVHRSKV